MSAAARDRKEWALGSFMESEDGPDYVRDALSNEAIKDLGKLIKGCDAAEAGAYLIQFLLTDKSIRAAIEAADAAEAEQDQRDMFAEIADFNGQFPSWERFTSRDSETGIPCRGEI